MTYLICLFTFGVLLLTIDEIIRLDNLKWGIGLLPFVPVTAFIATALFFVRNKFEARGVNPVGSFKRRIVALVLSFWILEIIMEGVKISSLMALKDSFPRKDTSYPISQQVMDIVIAIVCMALVVLFMLLEGFQR